MNRKPIDPNSRDYSFEDIEMDERFVQTLKEWWITVIFFAVHVALLISNLYLVGKDPANYSYVMGLPLWMFLMLCEFVLVIVSVFLIVDKVFLHMDITPRGKLYPRGIKGDEAVEQEPAAAVAAESAKED